MARTVMSPMASGSARVINTTTAHKTLRAGTLLGTSEQVCICPENEPEMPSVANDEQAEYSANENDASLHRDVVNKLCESLPAELTEEQVTQTRELLNEFGDIFSTHQYDIGRTNLVYHRIETGNHPPIRQPLRRQPDAYQDVIDTQVADMLRHGVIERSNSEWASNVVLARKKDGSMRFCLDYRALNAITHQDSYPLPRIDSCIDAVKNSTYFSTLDLRAGYFNVPIHKADRDKTSFVTRRGSFRFNVMPFGLKCAPAEFQRLMDLALNGLTFEICMVFLDDVVIFSSDFLIPI